MSLTVGQAQAINTIVNHLVGRQTYQAARPSTRQALEAAMVLLPAAHKRLGAGWTAQQVDVFLNGEADTDPDAQRPQS